MGLKDNYMHKTSCARCAVEKAKLLEEKSKDKMLLCMNADVGGDRNQNFERVQACMSFLVIKLNLDKLVREKTSTSGIMWNS